MSNVNTHEKYCLATAVNAAAQTRWFLVPYSDRDSFPPLTEKTKYDRSERDPNQFRLRDRIQYDTVILEDTTEKPQQRINDKTTKKWNKKGNEGGRTAAKFNASNITIEWPGREKMEVEKAQKDTKSDQMMNLQNQQIDIYIYVYICIDTCWYFLCFFLLCEWLHKQFLFQTLEFVPNDGGSQWHKARFACRNAWLVFVDFWKIKDKLHVMSMIRMICMMFW